VSLAAVKELVSIDSANGELKIGAMTPLAVLERSDAVRTHAPVITNTLRTLSNIRVRNVATVGGSLAHADPHMDLPPVLIALGARVVVQGKSGERVTPVADLFAGYYETVLAKDELISSLIVPAQNGRRAAYLKVTTRAVHDWPAVGVAVSVAADGNVINDAAIVVSAATEKPGRLADAERAAKGAADDAAFRRVGEAAAAEAELITDAQGSAAYKRELLRVYVARALRAAVEAK
jgi:carbon-monoxide dehydrogenase medium subunit